MSASNSSGRLASTDTVVLAAVILIAIKLGR